MGSNPKYISYIKDAEDVLGSNFTSQLLRNDTHETFFSKTSNAQPAIVLSTCLILQYFKDTGVDLVERADYLVGHSLGEYTALVAAGALSLKQGLQLTRKRGTLMEQCIEKYYQAELANSSNRFKMVSLFVRPQHYLMLKLSLDSTPNIHIANINSPKQINVVGLKNDLDFFFSLSKVRFRTKDMPVEIPFHSDHLLEAQLQLKEYIATVEIKSTTLKTPLVSNYKHIQTSQTNEALELVISNTSKVVDFLGLVRDLHREKSIKQFDCLGPGNIAKVVSTIKEVDQLDIDIDSFALPTPN